MDGIRRSLRYWRHVSWLSCKESCAFLGLPLGWPLAFSFASLLIAIGILKFFLLEQDQVVEEVNWGVAIVGAALLILAPIFLGHVILIPAREAERAISEEIAVRGATRKALLPKPSVSSQTSSLSSDTGILEIACDLEGGLFALQIETDVEGKPPYNCIFPEQIVRWGQTLPIQILQVEPILRNTFPPLIPNRRIVRILGVEPQPRLEVDVNRRYECRVAVTSDNHEPFLGSFDFAVGVDNSLILPYDEARVEALKVADAKKQQDMMKRNQEFLNRYSKEKSGEEDEEL